MKPIEELGIVVGIFAGIWTLAQAFGKSGGNTCGVPASAPSGTVQTTPFAGSAPSIPIPQLTNPFTSTFPQFQPVTPQNPNPGALTCHLRDAANAPTCHLSKPTGYWTGPIYVPGPGEPQ